jgi:hypothetical protein
MNVLDEHRQKNTVTVVDQYLDRLYTQLYSLTIDLAVHNAPTILRTIANNLRVRHEAHMQDTCPVPSDVCILTALSRPHSDDAAAIYIADTGASYLLARTVISYWCRIVTDTVEYYGGPECR